MSRFTTALLPAQERQQRETEDGDAIFIGMDKKTPVEYLNPGYYSDCVNGRSADGRMAVRPGTVKPAFANIVPFGTTLGDGVYSNPNGLLLLLIATPTQVIGINDGGYPIIIPIPAGTTLSGPCSFDQNFNQVYLNNLNTTLVWDGLSPSGFVANVQQNPGNPLVAITPNVVWSQNMGNRRVFPLTTSSIGVTPINDYTEYNTNPLNQAPFIGSFRINTSTSDPLVGVLQFGVSNLIIAKRYSLDILSGFTGDLSSANMQTLSSEIGLASRRAMKMVGADMIFPFDTGIYRIQQVIQDRIAASALPVAAYQDQFGNIVDPIEPILRKINWSAASAMSAAVAGPNYFLAVPLSPSTVCNAVLVYNTIKDKWEGMDVWQDAKGNNLIQIDDLQVFRYQGQAKIYCIDTKANAIYVLYEGKSDILATGEFQIPFSFQTRGYSAMSASNQFKRAEIGLATWWPSINISEISDQYNDVRLLTQTPITKDPTKYGIFGLKNYDITNVNSDFNNVGRQDYSISDGTFFDNNGTGINIEQTQQSTPKFSTMARGRWMSYLITNNQGWAAVDGVLLRSTTAPRQQLSTAA